MPRPLWVWALWIVFLIWSAWEWWCDLDIEDKALMGVAVAVIVLLLW